MNKILACRVCLQTGLLKYISLFDQFKDDLVSKHITSIAAVEIHKDDKLPQGICPQCLLQLDNALEFKRKCESTDQLLHSATFKLECEVDSGETTECKEDNECKDIIKDTKSIDIVKEENTELEDDLLEPVGYFDFEDTAEHTDEVEVRKSRAIDLKLICDDCGGSFKSKCKLRVHWKKVHLHEKLCCQICKRMFKSYKAYNRHLKRKTRACLTAAKVKVEGQGRNRIFHCTQCSYKTKSANSADSHVVTHTGEKRYHCNICPKSYSQISSLICHKESCHKMIRYEITCHICGLHITGRDKAHKHMRKHQPRNIKCTVCSKTFNCTSALNAHMIRHTGIKAFTCEMCGKIFYTAGELSTHRRKIHFKNITFKYKCDKCQYQTNHKHLFLKHTRKHTGTNIPCPVCHQFFDDPVKYASHKKNHEEKNYPCPMCDKKYATSKSRSHHMRKHRGIEKKGTEESGKKLKEENIEQDVHIEETPLLSSPE